MVIYQGDEKLCGWAATRMLLVSLTHARAYARLSLRGKPPYNLLHLAEGARAAGVELTFKRAYDKASIRRARRFPLLLVLGSEEEGHMVLLRGRLGSLFVLDDPAAGRRLVSFRKLLASWSGVYGEGRRVEKLVPPRAKRSFVPFYGRFLTPLLEALVAILLAVGFFFLGDDLLFLSPLSSWPRDSSSLPASAFRFASSRTWIGGATAYWPGRGTASSANAMSASSVSRKRPSGT